MSITAAIPIHLARPQLGSLADSALAGNPVFLIRNGRKLALVPASEPDPIPIMPVGTYAVTANDPLAVAMKSYTPPALYELP
ncbi:MAG: hypothetical protein WC378_02720 [Opitutaceae bacterium]|jgi:hypothetical protein